MNLKPKTELHAGNSWSALPSSIDHFELQL